MLDKPAITQHPHCRPHRPPLEPARHRRRPAGQPRASVGVTGSGALGTVLLRRRTVALSGLGSVSRCRWLAKCVRMSGRRQSRLGQERTGIAAVGGNAEIRPQRRTEPLGTARYRRRQRESLLASHGAEFGGAPDGWIRRRQSQGSVRHPRRSHLHGDDRGRSSGARRRSTGRVARTGTGTQNAPAARPDRLCRPLGPGLPGLVTVATFGGRTLVEPIHVECAPVFGR